MTLILPLLNTIYNGVQQWVRRYNGPGNESATAGIVYFRGYIYVAGRNNDIGSDYLVIKYNSAGDSLWVRVYDSGGMIMLMIIRRYGSRCSR
jgi:hypothetical protein